MRSRGILASALVVSFLATACDGGAAPDGTTATGPRPSMMDIEPTASTSRPVDLSTTTSLVPSSPVDAVWSGAPVVRDPTEYTRLGISADEAQRRNALVEMLLVSDLFDWLRERHEFFWVEETADSWALVVARTETSNNLAKRVRNRVADTPLEGLVEIRSVARDLDDLRWIETRVVRLITDWCLPRATSIDFDYPRNQVVIGVHSMTEFVDATDWAGISFEDIDGVVVEERPAETPPGARTAPCQAPVLALNAAREQWAAHDLDRYAYRVTATSTWVGSVDVGEVLVWDGAVTEVLPPELTPDSLFYPPRFGVRYGTIERLFDVVESHPVPWVIATYDVERGFPKSFSFNDPSWFDEEWGFRIDDFRILDSAPDPAPPRQNRHDDDSLEIERWLPWKIAVVDAVIHPASGVYHRDWGWRHTVDVTTLVYAAPGADPIAAGPIEVIDRVGFSAPRALLHSAGDSARLMLVPGSEDHWEVFAVLELTPEGLRLDGPLARRGYSEEVRYLCHYPRSEVPSDPPPERDAEAEFELLLRWLDERGPVDPDGAWGASNAEALRRVCEEA